MKVITTGRGFQELGHIAYPPVNDSAGRLVQTRLVAQSSAIAWDKYDDALHRPGTSYLWIGNGHHLDRDEVRELVGYLQRWLETGSLREAGPDLAVFSSLPDSD